MQQKKKEKKGRQKKKVQTESKSLKTEVNFDFCACLSHNVVKRDAGGKKGKLLCCKRISDRIKANLTEIQFKKLPKCAKNAFLQKVPGVNKLTLTPCVWPLPPRNVT